MILIVMGVSGCGKSTIGRLLANRTGLPFYDGDDYHPESNLEKMKNGKPLTDADRQGWLERLNRLAKDNIDSGAVIVCSALKEAYREILKNGIEPKVIFIYLEGSYSLIQDRLQKRTGHFMPPELLQSQFDVLEPPENAIRVSIDAEPAVIIDQIMQKLR